ncbi:class I SAM-dependent methyltransferase [Microbacterium sp. A94]|uniref:class I SAM-dependent methyltransferase n=1 Tax=Microbacterium sp. A94 TaxID=3450717 RepID=UPI003F429D2C
MQAELAEVLDRSGAVNSALSDLKRLAQTTSTELQDRATATATAVSVMSANIDGANREVREILSDLESSVQATLSTAQRGADAATQTMTALQVTDRRLVRAFDGGNSHSLERRIVAEVSALSLLQPSERTLALPPVDGWAMSPLALHFIESEASKLGSDSTVVELGSGVSTAWIALALSRLDNPPQFVAVEHDREFATSTTRQLADMGQSANVTVVLAPLEPVEGMKQQWYATDWIASLGKIGLLIVDGPPAGTQTNARFPALPLLLDHLSDRAMIFVDDADRPGEAGMVAEWLKIPGIRRGRNVGRSLVLDFVRETEAHE